MKKGGHVEITGFLGHLFPRGAQHRDQVVDLGNLVLDHQGAQGFAIHRIEGNARCFELFWM